MIASICKSCEAYWLAPSKAPALKWVRLGLSIVTAVYFLAAWSDLEIWYAAGSPASSSNLATFFRTAGLASEASWMVSPLFLWDSLLAGTSLSESLWIYRVYLILGIVLSVFVGVASQPDRVGLPKVLVLARQSCLPNVLLWVWFVGWANRTVLLAGITEPLLSISLACIAIAPISAKDGSSQSSWRNTLAKRLLSVHATFFLVVTFTTMLSSPAWWNGTGAYALVAPVEDRLIDVRGSFFESAPVFELTSAMIVLGIPLSLWLGWKTPMRRVGITMLIIWCIVTGLMSANILYMATLAIIATTIGDHDGIHTAAGTDGAETLNSGCADTLI